MRRAFCTAPEFSHDPLGRRPCLFAPRSVQLDSIVLVAVQCFLILQLYTMPSQNILVDGIMGIESYTSTAMIHCPEVWQRKAPGDCADAF
jgi:hypothetical protein